MQKPTNPAELFNYEVKLESQDYPNNMKYETVTEVKLTAEENFADVEPVFEPKEEE